VRQSLPERWDALLHDLAAGKLGADVNVPPTVRRMADRLLRPVPTRARALASIGPSNPAAVWPELRLISCWADGNAAAGVRPVCHLFPNARVQPKGLLATEAFISIPFGPAKVLAVRSHVFEFFDDAGRSRLPHEVEPGGTYAVAVTTAGGLYRYRLGDRVRVTGFLGGAPTLDFLGRDDLVVDLCGEKLSEGFVAGVLAEVASEWTFRILAPNPPDGEAGYTLYVHASNTEQPIDSAVLDRMLCRNSHYRHCRQLGQLRHARVFGIVGDPYRRYVATMSEAGQRIGDVKANSLSRIDRWSTVFAGNHVE
jgi:hypothetical protein